MPDNPDVVLNSKGKPFASKTYAEKFLPDGYVAVERDGGWVGVNGSATVDKKNIAERIDLGPDYFGKDVICPGCGLSHHETTADYDPDKNANLAMLRLKHKYREWGWEELPIDPHSGYGCLVCPECGAALAPSGRIKVRKEEK